jgi:hypothetical protein
MSVKLPLKTRNTVKTPVKASVKTYPTGKRLSMVLHEGEVPGLAKYINALGIGKTTAQNHVVL